MRGMRKAIAPIVAVASLTLVGCSGNRPAPRPLVDGEECAFCRMMIDRPQYAAQLVEGNGEHRAFDHPLCMIRYVERAEARTPGYRGSVRAYYVADLYTGRWLRAERARYVVHPSIPTVMDYGVVASDSASAKALADSVGGRLVTFAELWENFRTGRLGR